MPIKSKKPVTKSKQADNKKSNQAKKTKTSPKLATVSAGLPPIASEVVNTALLSTITPLGLNFQRNSFTLGANYCCVFGIIRFPMENNLCWLARLTNLPNTIVSVSSTPLNSDELRKNMSRKAGMSESKRRQAKNLAESLEFAKAYQQSESVIKRMNDNDEIFVDYCATVMVVGQDEKSFKQNCDRAKHTMAAIGCSFRILSNTQKQAFRHLAPYFKNDKLVCSILNRPWAVSSFVGGFPFSRSGFADDGGFFLGKNADGGAIFYNPWLRGDTRTNGNIVLMGASGMGKSTVLKHIILSEYARGTKIIIIDPEGEYREICLSRYVNGSWIDVAGGGSPAGSLGGRINPLHVRPAPRDDEETLVEDRFAPDTEIENGDNSSIGDVSLHIHFLKTFFKLYIPSLTEVQVRLLMDIIIELYTKFGIKMTTDISDLRAENYPTMSDLHSLILEKAAVEIINKTELHNLALLVSAAAKGEDKGLWDGKTTIKGDNDFIVLDTKSIAQVSGGVLRAQYFNVLSWCWEQIASDKKQRVMLVVDEAWMMIDPECPQSLTFLRNAEKRARKYEGSIVVSTQNIVDFLDPTVKRCGQEVLDSPAVKILFGADGKTLKEITDTFNLNQAQHDLIEARQRGVALMKVGAQPAKVRFEFTEERLAMFGSGGGR